MIEPLKLAFSSGPGNGAGAGMRYVAGLVLFTVPSCVTRGAALLTCSSAALGSRSRDHTQEIASSFPVPFVSFSRSSHFVFLPLPFSLLPSLSLLFAPDIYPLVPPPGLWALRPKQTRPPFSLLHCLQRVLQLVPATATFHTAKTDDLPLHPGGETRSPSLSLQQRPRGCPLNLTMLLLLSSAQLCRLVCSTRAQRSQ